MNISIPLSEQFRAQLQPFCEQRGLRVLTQEEFDSEQIPRLTTLRMEYETSEHISDVQDTISGNFVQSLSTTRLPPNTIGIFGEIITTRIEDIMKCSVLVYCF